MLEKIMLERTKNSLGANYIQNTDDILQDIMEELTSIACDISNRRADDKKLFPYIKKAVISEYLARGAEGLNSRSEGGISSSFKDIIEELRNNIIKSGLRRIR